MNRDDIRDAIMLFQYSNTAQLGARAKGLLSVLWNLYKVNEIGFHNIGEASLHGDYQVRAGNDLRINTAYIDSLPSTLRLAALSLVLVHEGIHAMVDFPSLYDELAARSLPIYYFRELSGPGVFNEASDPPRPGGRTATVRVPPGSMPYFDEQSALLNRDQLVDYLFSMDTYTGDRYVNPQWIVDNLNNWHGLGRRWPETRGLYIRKLAKRADTYFTRAILDIMESTQTRTDWNAMMAEAGPRRAIRTALDDVSVHPRYTNRILALERRWGVHLCDDPPAPRRVN